MPCTIAPWPIVTSSSITLGTSVSQWTHAPSCTFTRRPIVTGATSPRTTALNQKLASSPTSTSPTIVLPRATKYPAGVCVKSDMRGMYTGGA